MSAPAQHPGPTTPQLALRYAQIRYRNFLPTDARWQFNGLRLARDLP